MADRETMLKALRNADKAGDVKAAQRIAGMIKDFDNVPQTPSAGQMPEQPAGMTYAGLPGRMQMDVSMGKTPTQVGGSLMLQTANNFIDWASDAIGKVTPQLVKDWFRYEVGSAFNALPNDYMKAASEGMESVQRWIANNPEKARAIDGLIMSASLTAPALKAGKKFSTMDKALTNSVTPYKNQHNVAEMLKDGRIKPGGTTDAEGWGLGMGKTVFVETDAVKAQKRALSTVEGFSPYQTNIKRLDLVDKEIVNSSKLLQQNLDTLGKTARGRISKQDLQTAFSKSQVRSRFNADKSIRRKNFLTDQEYNEILDDIKYHLRSNRADGSISVGEIHKQRKLIDHAYRNAKGQRRLNGELNPTRDELKWRTERDILNRLVDRVAPGTKEERIRLKNLYDVSETLHQKATKGNLRFYDDAAEHVPFMGEKKIKILPRGGR